MPLPQQVIERLSRDTPQTPGWSSGVVMFSGGLLFITIIIYFGMLMGYTPYLDAQIKIANDKVNQLSQSISSDDQTQLLTFYSQISNLQSLIQGHVFFSRFLQWLESNTESNVYYTQLSFASGNQITLTGFAQSESDINQQVAILEASPSVEHVNVTNVGLSNTNNQWTFSATLVMPASAFSSPFATIGSAGASSTTSPSQ